MTAILQIRKRGTITLPVGLRKKYSLEEGDPLTVIDLGEGIFLSPRPALLPKLAGRIEKLRKKYDLSLEELIKSVAEQRKEYSRGFND